jgi:uncharacterized membrane protein HdeD (DUF308 family)
MLLQIASHRWVWWVQGVLALVLGIFLLVLRGQMQDPVRSSLSIGLAVVASGFVLLLAGILDLVIAVDVAGREHNLRPALLWWATGMIGITLGTTLLLLPEMSLRWLAYVAAAQALLIAAVDLVTLSAFHRHPVERRVVLCGALGSTVLAAVLLAGALGTEAGATRALGYYAMFFGGRLLLIGAEFSGSRLPILKLKWNTHSA